MENQEMLPIVDEAGNITGSALRSLCHDGSSMLLHPVVHLHVVDSFGRLLLQRRSMNKKIQPGKWDTAVGGHIALGESALNALCREAAEEIGVREDLSEPGAVESVRQYPFRSDVERELICTYLWRCSDSFCPEISEPDQIDELRFFSMEEIDSLIKSGHTTPNFAEEYKNLISDFLKGRSNK